MAYYCIAFTMQYKNNINLNEISMEQAMEKEILAAKGALTQVRKSCGKKECKKCASGENHSAWLYMYRLNGKTCSKHVPKHAVGNFRQMLDKGWQVEQELVLNGIAYLDSLKKNISE